MCDPEFLHIELDALKDGSLNGLPWARDECSLEKWRNSWYPEEQVDWETIPCSPLSIPFLSVNTVRLHIPATLEMTQGHILSSRQQNRLRDNFTWPILYPFPSNYQLEVKDSEVQKMTKPQDERNLDPKIITWKTAHQTLGCEEINFYYVKPLRF